MQSVCATRRHSHAYGTGEKYSRVEHEDVIDEEDEQLASGATRGTKVECICKRRMHNRYPASWHGTGFGAQCGHDTCQERLRPVSRGKMMAGEKWPDETFQFPPNPTPSRACRSPCAGSTSCPGSSSAPEWSSVSPRLDMRNEPERRGKQLKTSGDWISR